MANKYIKYVPKPLLDDFVNGRVVPFVGAGFSKNADIPNGVTMPNWNELGEKVAESLQNYTYDNNAIDALSYYEMLYTRPKLIELLMELLHVEQVSPGETHKAFCDLFTGIICTTNFDFLLEASMNELNRTVSAIVTEDRLTVNSKDESRIIKVHGDFNHPDKMVLTERDYDMYLDKNPILATYISNLFITNTMFLVGYSLDDYDFRGIWQIINSRLGAMSQPAYCVIVKADDITVARYKRRHVRVINLPGEPKNYSTILRDFFVELREYITNEKAKTVTSVGEKINEQFLIPADDNRLCFVSCSASRIARLSAFLDPILINSGITPVHIVELLADDNNAIELSRTVMRKCKLAIVDISDSYPNIYYELGLLMKEKGDNTLIICEKDKKRNIPISICNFRIVEYNFQDSAEFDSYNIIQNWIDNISGIYSNINADKSEILLDAYRLFQKKEYSACIISVYSELDYNISQNTIYNIPKEINIRKKLSQLDENVSNIKAHECINSLIKYTSLRNAIAHEGRKSTKKEASLVINYAKELYDYVLRSD